VAPPPNPDPPLSSEPLHPLRLPAATFSTHPGYCGWRPGNVVRCDHRRCVQWIRRVGRM